MGWHARAARAQVTALVEREELRVEVRDDGIGGARGGYGTGLGGLEDRVAAVGEGAEGAAGKRSQPLHPTGALPRNGARPGISSGSLDAPGDLRTRRRPAPRCADG